MLKRFMLHFIIEVNLSILSSKCWRLMADKNAFKMKKINVDCLTWIIFECLAINLCYDTNSANACRQNESQKSKRKKTKRLRRLKIKKYRIVCQQPHYMTSFQSIYFHGPEFPLPFLMMMKILSFIQWRRRKCEQYKNSEKGEKNLIKIVRRFHEY